MIILQIFLWILFALAVLLCIMLFMKFSVRLKYGQEKAVILGFGIVKINLTKLRERREKKQKKPKIQSLKKTLPPKNAVQCTAVTKVRTEKTPEQYSTAKTAVQTNAQIKPQTNTSDSKSDEKHQTKEAVKSGQSTDIVKMLKDFVKGKSLTENLTLLKEILVQTSQRFSKYASIKVKKLRVTVSCPEAADTAVLFGIANGVVCSVVGIIESFSMLYVEKGAVGVYQDYLSGKSSLEVDIYFSMRVFRLVLCAIPALRVFMTKGKNPHQRSKNK